MPNSAIFPTNSVFLYLLDEAMSVQMQGIAYLIDLDGTDSYKGTSPAQGESGGNSYHFESTGARSFSLLLYDGGDEDSYFLERKLTNN